MSKVKFLSIKYIGTKTVESGDIKKFGELHYLNKTKQNHKEFALLTIIFTSTKY